MSAPGTRAQRQAVVSAIVLAGAGNALTSFGENPDSGYYDDVKDMPYELVAAITADLLKNMPGTAWDSRLPDVGTPAPTAQEATPR